MQIHGPDTAIETDWDAALGGFQEQMLRLHRQPGVGSKALDVPVWDQQLWQLGREWLARNAGQAPATITGETPPEGTGPDVYLATRIYQSGGHTALIGDFVRALEADVGNTGSAPLPPHLILTNLHGQKMEKVPEAIRARMSIPAENIIMLETGNWTRRLRQAFDLLIKLRPRRLFLFHHPEDPLASIVAHPEIAPLRVLVHHADSMPSFGLQIPGMKIIDLNPAAPPLTRMLGLNSSLLMLTAPDPGPRPEGFLKRGNLVTATSGSAYKYASHYFFSYPETVGVILRSTGGWHVHIGPLDERALSQIRRVLHERQIEASRFVHVPWTPSVAACLWEHDCDVYFSSFPIDGARTTVEVLASSTPHLRHSTTAASGTAASGLQIQGGMVWRTWEDLSSILQSLSTPGVLEEKSRLARITYEQLHHPRVFAANLRNILGGLEGCVDPMQDQRDLMILRSMMKSLVANAFARPPDSGIEAAPRAPFGSNAASASEICSQIDKQAKRIDFLQEQRKKLQKQIDDLEAERRKWRVGKSLRAMIVRWLLGA